MLKAGDNVKVYSKGSMYHGQRGTVTHVEKSCVDTWTLYSVKLNTGVTCFGGDELQRVNFKKGA